MVHNSLTKLTFNINKSDDVVSELNKIFNNDLTIYSYIVFNKGDTYNINIQICENDSCNTICCKDCLLKIRNVLNNNDKVLIFEQPPLDIIVNMFKPYISKLSRKFSSQWLKLEYDDIFQTGMMSMVKLYKQGYYLNKFIIARSFQNDILLQLRHFRNEPIIVSIDTCFNNELSNDNELTYGDIIVDTKDLNEREDKENSEYVKSVFDEMKDIIVDKYGPRTFDKLYNDYSKKHTDNFSRKTMQTLKTYLEKMNINRHSFDKYL